MIDRRIGEANNKAKLSDHDIDLMFALRAEGMSVPAIAAKFEVSRMQAWRVLNFRQRTRPSPRLGRKT